MVLILWFLGFFFNALRILFRVIFFTLLERKILSYSQNRIGPNKIVFLGIFQPLLDGVKLILNEKISSFKFNKFFFLLGPFILLLVMLFLWFSIPINFLLFSLNYFILFFIRCLGFSIYRRLLRGWSSNSKYSIIGGIRRISQTISYELTLIFSILGIYVFFNSLRFLGTYFYQSIFFFICIPFFLFWCVNILAECGRAPFDFIEGERELVRGFNTEFSRRIFAILFVGEYGLIIFFSLFSILIFLNISLLWYIFRFIILRFFLIVRSSFPRFRYDFLINLAWIKILPIRIFYLGLIYFLSF